MTFSHYPHGGSVIFADECCTWRYEGASIRLRPSVPPEIEHHMKEAVRIAHHLPRKGTRVEL